MLHGRLTPDLQLDGIAWPRNTAEIERAYNGIRFVLDVWRNNKQNAQLRALGSNIGVGRTAQTLTVRVRVPYPDLVALLDYAAARQNYPFR